MTPSASTLRQSYVIGVIDYGEVRVFEDVATALREWDVPDDVLSDVIIFYGSDGNWLKPILHEGPRRWLGLRRGVRWVTLQRSESPEPSIDPLALALFEANTMTPNRHFASLEELRARFPWLDAGANEPGEA